MYNGTGGKYTVYELRKNNLLTLYSNLITYLHYDINIEENYSPCSQPYKDTMNTNCQCKFFLV